MVILHFLEENVSIEPDSHYKYFIFKGVLF